MDAVTQIKICPADRHFQNFLHAQSPGGASKPPDPDCLNCLSVPQAPPAHPGRSANPARSHPSPSPINSKKLEALLAKWITGTPSSFNPPGHIGNRAKHNPDNLPVPGCPPGIKHLNRSCRRQSAFQIGKNHLRYFFHQRMPDFRGLPHHFLATQVIPGSPSFNHITG